MNSTPPEKMKCLETEIFRMGNRNFAFHMVSLYGKPWLVGSVILVALSTVFALTIDLRWAIIALIILFLVTPALLMFLYFFYGLNPVSAINVIDHRIRISDKGIEIDLFQTFLDEESGKEALRLSSTQNFAFESLEETVTGLSSIIMSLRRPGKGFLWLPAHSYASPEDFAQAAKMIIEKTPLYNHKNL